MRPRLLRSCVAALAVAGFLTLAPRASADVINLTFDAGVTGNPNGNGLNGGGAFHWTQTTPINTNYASAVTTYCIDVRDTLNSSGTNSFNVTSLSNAPTLAGSDLTKINSLFTHYYNTSLTSSTLEAAFQLALWDLVYGSSNPILTNYLSALTSLGFPGDNSTVTADATKMLNGTLTETKADLTDFTLYALVDTSGASPGTKYRSQDQIMVVPNVTINPHGSVPAPPAVMLAGIGMLALFGRARWNRKATPTA